MNAIFLYTKRFLFHTFLFSLLFVLVASLSLFLSLFIAPDDRWLSFDQMFRIQSYLFALFAVSRLFCMRDLRLYTLFRIERINHFLIAVSALVLGAVTNMPIASLSILAVQGMLLVLVSDYMTQMIHTEMLKSRKELVNLCDKEIEQCIMCIGGDPSNFLLALKDGTYLFCYIVYMKGQKQMITDEQYNQLKLTSRLAN